MSIEEQPRPERRQSAKSSDASQSARIEPAAGARPAWLVRDDAPRIWALPSAQGEILIVPEVSSIEGLAEALRHEPPEWQAPVSMQTDVRGLARRSWKTLEARFAEEQHEAIFDFSKRIMVSIAWLVVAAAGVRIHEAFESGGIVLGVLGLGFLGYTIARYGYRIVRWHNRRVDANHAFARAKLTHNPLAARIAKALELRSTLKPEDRGKSPDDELLDTNAYRKLIDNKVTSAKELIRLGEALDFTLKLHDAQGQSRRIAEIASDAGLDVDTAIFYRDLSASAAEIKLLANVE